MSLLPLLALLSALLMRADGAMPGVASPIPGVQPEKSFEERLEVEWKELKTEHVHDWRELVGAASMQLPPPCMRSDRPLHPQLCPPIPCMQSIRPSAQSAPGFRSLRTPRGGGRGGSRMRRW